MNRSEKFIEEHTKNCSNELISIESAVGTKILSYYEWLTPDNARKAVEIAREEIYDWLENNLPLYNACDSFLEKCRLLKDLKQAMKDET